MLKGLVWGENLRDILRIVRATAAWAVIPLIVEEIRDEAALRKLLAGLATVLVIVSVTIILFSWDPGLVPPTDDMAVAREEWFGGFQRIFHVGMWGAVAGAIVALGVGFYDARWRTAGPLIGLVLCFGLFFTFVRTFIMLVIMSVGIFVLDRTRFNRRAMIKPLAIAVVVLLLLSALPLGEKVMTAVSDRMSSVLSADVTEIDPTDQEGLGTLVWRILAPMRVWETFRERGTICSGPWGGVTRWTMVSQRRHRISVMWGYTTVAGRWDLSATYSFLSS
ncbi:MAG: hypothetical protein IPI01_21080 [Ignavibacteriae bacterium]|nr:hypothetical protein [Ignavibacteriota bacterium]